MSQTILANNMLGTYGTIYYVSNMQQSVNWYKSLGLTPSYESEAWTEFPLNGHSLCLHIADPQQKQITSGLVIIRVSKIHDVIADLKSKHITVVDDIGEIYPGAGAYRAKISDLDNNIISFYEGPMFG